MIQTQSTIKPDSEKMASALRAIATWAAYDIEHGHRALDPKHVLELCNKALRVEAR